MSRTITTTLQSILRHALIAAFGFAALAVNATISPDIPAWGLRSYATHLQVQAALDTISELPSLVLTEIDPALRSVGFTPPLGSTDWRALPNRDKLRVAYRHADAAENGQEFLSAMAHQLAQHYDSVRFDPAFRPFLSADSPKVKFVAPPPSVATKPIDPAISRMIDAISSYVSGSGPLSRVNILREHFGLHSPQFEEVLGVRDPAQFLRTALNAATPPPTEVQRVNNLFESVIRNSESAAYDPKTKEIAAALRDKYGEPLKEAKAHGLSVGSDGTIHEGSRWDNPPDPDMHSGSPDMPPAPPGGSGGPSSGGPGMFSSGTKTESRVQSAVRRQAKFDATYYSTPASRAFESVMMRVGGRGGIVAGAEVGSDSSLAHLRSVSIRLPGNQCAAETPLAVLGDVVVETTNGEQYAYTGVPCDTLIAAKNMVYPRFKGLSEWHPGEAIGLATIDLVSTSNNRTFAYFVPQNQDITQAAHRWRMILHPALVDLDIGRAVALLDLWPSASDALAKAVSFDPRATKWLDAIERNKTITWRWSDRPAHVDVISGRLTVQFVGKDESFQFRAFSEDDGILEEAANVCNDPSARAQLAAKKLPCDKILGLVHNGLGRNLPEMQNAAPVLVSHIEEFSRVDDLFRTLVIFKMARSAGASLIGIEPTYAGRRPVSPDTVLVGILGDYIAGGTQPGLYKSDCQTFRARLVAGLRAPAPPGTDGMRYLLAKTQLSEDAITQAVQSCTPGQ